MNLHTNKELFKESIAIAADYFGYEPSHVEKDYWVSKMLKDIADSEYSGKVYFKGGTSLSKAYNLIERFSEDLDLFVFTGNVESSKSAEKTLNKRVCEHLVAANKDMYRDDLSTGGGNYRKLMFDYENQFQTIGLKEHLEVEVKSCDLTDKAQMYYPNDQRTIKPIIASFFEETGNEALAAEYGLNSFEIPCINPRKTICDKISRLVKLSHKENVPEELATHIRDVYDLMFLYQHSEYNAFMHSDEFLEAMYKVTIEDALSKNSRSHLSLCDATIFKDASTLLNHPVVSSAYQKELADLAFDRTKLPPIEQAKSALIAIQGILVRFEEYRSRKTEEQEGN